MPELDKPILLETYKLVLAEEQYFNTIFENRLTFYTGLVTTILSATILGVVYSAELKNYIVLLFGPVLVSLVSIAGIKAGNRANERLLRIFTVRAKIEQALGLTLANKFQKKSDELYWVGEPIIDIDHLASRKKHNTSKEFSDYTRNKHQGYLKLINLFYRSIIFMSIVLEGYLIYLAANF